jgi:hypothetical protein
MPVVKLENRNANTMRGAFNFVRYVMGEGSPIGDTNMSSQGKFPDGSEYIDTLTGNKYMKKGTNWMIISGMLTGAGAPAAGFYAAGSINIYPIGANYYDTTNNRLYRRVLSANASTDWKYAALT